MAPVRVNIATNPTFLGLNFNVQAVTVSLGTNALGVVTSNGIMLTVRRD